MTKAGHQAVPAPQREAFAELYRTRTCLSDQDCHNLQYQADRITRLAMTGLKKLQS